MENFPNIKLYRDIVDSLLTFHFSYLGYSSVVDERGILQALADHSLNFVR
jgi:hypothetical protein